MLCAGLQYKFRLVFLIVAVVKVMYLVTHDSAVVWISNVIVSEEMMIFLLFSLKWVYANKNYEMIYNEH